MNDSVEEVTQLRIAVLIPCYNEEKAIAKVVSDFKIHLPLADVFVYDNNSTDNTIEEAKNAGAIIRSEHRQGKGYVVRRMFADIDADIYVMIDGDDTYDVSAIQKLIKILINENLDMINGARVENDSASYRRGHKMGNKMLSGIVRLIFGNEFKDMLSGYRVFSNRFVKSFPQASKGFEIETELTVHALELQMPTREIPINFKERAKGSISKLNTFSDGFRILWTVFYLLKQERPLATFFTLGIALMILALILIFPIFITYYETGFVPRFPTAILATGLVITSFLSFACGLILDTVTRGRQEIKRLYYLSISSTQSILLKLN